MSQVAYRSTDSAVIAAIEAEKTARVEWSDKLRALGRELFGRGKGDFYSTDRSWFSFMLPDGPFSMPDGWKDAPRGRGGIVPDKRTAVGKTWAKRIDPLKSIPGTDAPPGMPQGFFDSDARGHYWRKPSYGVVNGVAWCRWGGEPTEKVDGSLWVKVNLSEFYAMAEAEGLDVA